MNFSDVRTTAKKWKISERRVTALCRAGRIGGAKKKGNFWLIPNDIPMPLDARTREYTAKMNDEKIKYSEFGGAQRAVNRFIQTYRKYPQSTAFTPYRICPIGAHTDHQLGKITGFAIDKGIHIAYGAKMNGVIEISSIQFPKRAQWHILSTPSKKQGDWADHLRGATIALSAKYPLRVGLCAVIDGELPIGGLSSSAAVIITFLSALCRLNNITLSHEELIDLSKNAENSYVGVSCGKLDQSCEVYCKKDKLLYMDLKKDKIQLIDTPKNMKPYEIIIFFSGLERSLNSTKYNMRVDECRSAAYALKAFAGIEYGKYEETNLCDVPFEVFEKYGKMLPENFRKRAEHWYSEVERVVKGVNAWKDGNINEFGRLIFESGKSSIEKWETGSRELIKMYDILKNTDGVYGGRFSGAGFKGCCMAIVNPKFEESILNTVKAQYIAAFPELTDKYSAHICHTADGVLL